MGIVKKIFNDLKINIENYLTKYALRCKVIAMDRKQEMLRMRLEGKSYKEIGEKFGITKQGVYDALKSIKISKRFVVDGEASGGKGIKRLLDKVVLRVKKHL